MYIVANSISLKKSEAIKIIFIRVDSLTRKTFSLDTGDNRHKRSQITIPELRIKRTYRTHLFFNTDFPDSKYCV